MPTLTWLGVDSNDKIRRFQHSEVCLCIMGKTSSECSDLKGEFTDWWPELVRFENLVSHPTQVKPICESRHAKRLLSKLISTYGIEVLEDPETIMSTGKATFSLKGSYNHTMYGMFHMRTLLNSCANFHIQGGGKLGDILTPDGVTSGIVVADKLMSEGLPWWQAYLSVIAPLWGLYNRSELLHKYNNIHEDGVVFRWDKVGKKTMYDILTRKYKFPYEKGDMQWIVKSRGYYPRNILKLSQDRKDESERMLKVYKRFHALLYDLKMEGGYTISTSTMFSVPDVKKVEVKPDEEFDLRYIACRLGEFWSNEFPDLGGI